MKKLLITISLLLLTIVVAQKPLEELAPSGALLSLGISYQGNLGTSLKQDFESMDWDTATATVSKLVKILLGSEKYPDFNDFIFNLQDGFNSFDGLEQICPDLKEELSANSHPEKIEILETIKLGSISNPSVTLLFRSEDNNSNLSAIYESAINCVKNTVDVSTLEQDGNILYVLDDGGDMPIIVSMLDNLVIASTSPDDVRKVIRLANGSNEKSLSDSYVYKQAQTELEKTANSLRISVDFSAVADSIQKLTGFFVGNDENRLALQRVLSSLYTLGGNVYQISAVEDGILKENVLTINPNGGDKALLKLINCQNCQILNPPILAPQDTISLNMSYIPWRQTYNYLQTLADDIGDIYGQPRGSIDLKEISKSSLDLDLDVALFNWLGSEVHSYTLEPIGPNLNTILYSPAQLTVIPVRSVEAAKAGLNELAKLLLPILEEYSSNAAGNNLLTDILPFSDELDTLDFAGFDIGQIASSSYQYKDINVNRIRFGPNNDFSYAFVNSNLVIATPAKAMEALIDTYESGLNIYLNQDFRVAKQSIPLGSSSFSYRETDAGLNSLADLLDLFSQPLAYGINKFLSSKIASLDRNDNSSNNATADNIEYDVFEADIEGISVSNSISPGASINGQLNEDDRDNYGMISQYYQLEDVNPGDNITVSLSSDDFDTQVWLIDSNRSVYITGNDDVDGADNGNSRFSFVAEEGNDYWLEISSFNGDGTGDYELSVSYGDQKQEAETESYEQESGQDFADLEGMTASDLKAPTTISGNLSSGQIDNYGNTTVFYHLTGIADGDIIKISANSEDFDTQLWLADHNDAIYLADNDDKDNDSTDSEIVFKAQDSQDYWIEISSYNNLNEGSYELTVEQANESDLNNYESNVITDSDLVEAEIDGMVASPIAAGETINGSLTEDEVDNYGAITDFYEIKGLNAGDLVSVSMKSDDLDSQLWLIDVNDKVYLADNDDVSDETLDAEISFVAEEGKQYWVEASTSSYGDSTIGDYSITVSVDADNSSSGQNNILPDSVSLSELTLQDVPGFEELLTLFDILPQSLRILANHTSNSVGYSKAFGENIYSRELCKISW